MNFTPIIQKSMEWCDAHFLAMRLLRHTPYILVFKTTNFCWYQCPHCCESAGPKNPRVFIPEQVIDYYLDLAKSDPCFSNNVVFTGGEIMSAYRVGSVDYVPHILNKSLDLDISTDIKTNAAWARAEFGNRIFQDLQHVISTHKPYALQISLSLDSFHKNALENNAAVISRLAKMPDVHVAINVARFHDYSCKMSELLSAVKAKKNSVDEVVYGDADHLKKGWIVNDRVLVLDSAPVRVFDGGRAKNMPGALHTEFPQFKFLAKNGAHLLALDTFGRATLGENSGRKISASWVSGKTAKHLMQVRSDLVLATLREELRARLFDGWRSESR